VHVFEGVGLSGSEEKTREVIDEDLEIIWEECLKEIKHGDYGFANTCGHILPLPSLPQIATHQVIAADLLVIMKLEKFIPAVARHVQEHAAAVGAQ